jgi:hypothetical protein
MPKLYQGAKSGAGEIISFRASKKIRNGIRRLAVQRGFRADNTSAVMIPAVMRELCEAGIVKPIANKETPHHADTAHRH